MPKPKRNSIKTVGEQLKVAQKAGKVILPPDGFEMSDQDTRFFNSIVNELGISEWTPHMTEMAAMLARAMTDMEENQRLLRSEGAVVYTDKGWPQPNPRQQVVKMNSTFITSMRRSLSLHARAIIGEPRDVSKRRGNIKEIEAGLEGDDDLINGPPLVN